MNISMDFLVFKLGLIAQLLDIVGLVGLGLFVAAIVWMVIRISNFESILPPLVGVLLSIVLVAGGLAYGPVSSRTAGMTVSAWLGNVLGVDWVPLQEYVVDGLTDFQDVMSVFVEENRELFVPPEPEPEDGGEGEDGAEPESTDE